MSNIFQAARQGKLARVEEILAQGGVDLASLDAHGYTALSYAAMSQNPVYLDVSKTLIRAGAPLNVPGERESPLHAAMLYKNYEVAALLVKSGAEVNVRDYLGNTPLKFAPDRSMAALLIAASADVNAAPVAKRTGPLHFAASSGNLGVIRELLSHPDIEVIIIMPGSLQRPLHWQPLRALLNAWPPCWRLAPTLVQPIVMERHRSNVLSAECGCRNVTVVLLRCWWPPATAAGLLFPSPAPHWKQHCW